MSAKKMSTRQRFVEYTQLGTAIGAMFAVLPSIVALLRLSWTVPLRGEELPILPIICFYVLGCAWVGIAAAALYRWLSSSVGLFFFGLIAAFPVTAMLAVLIHGIPWTPDHWGITFGLLAMGPLMCWGVKSST